MSNPLYKILETWLAVIPGFDAYSTLLVYRLSLHITRGSVVANEVKILHSSTQVFPGAATYFRRLRPNQRRVVARIGIKTVIKSKFALYYVISAI